MFGVIDMFTMDGGATYDTAPSEDGGTDIFVMVPDDWTWHACRALGIEFGDWDIAGDEQHALVQWLEDRQSAIEDVYAERYNGDFGGDEWGYDYLSFAVHLDDPNPSEEAIVTAIWPTVAKFLNESDPGTFGAEYIGRLVEDRYRDRIKERLEHLRDEIRAERIGYGEIAELQALVEYIEPGDVELLAWAGVEEGE